MWRPNLEDIESLNNAISILEAFNIHEEAAALQHLSNELTAFAVTTTLTDVMVYTHKWRDHKTVYLTTLSNSGHCKVSIWDEPTMNRKVATLYDLIVYPNDRGKGIGNELLSSAIRVAAENGCCLMLLWPDCEPWVEEWYKRKGFRLEPSLFNDQSEPAYVKKLLNP